MRTRILAAAAIALGSLTLSSASAATPTEVVFDGPSILQVGVPNQVTAHVQGPDRIRLGGPAGQAPGLTFQLGAARAQGVAEPYSSEIVAEITPLEIGSGLALEIDFAGMPGYQPAATVTRVDVWEHVLVDDTDEGMLLLNPTRNELRVIAGSYDSGTLTGVQMTSAGPVLALDADTTDANGQQLMLKGSVLTDRGTFTVVGLADAPFTLAHV